MNSRTARAKELYALLGDLPDRDRPISCETMAEEEHPAYRLEKLMLDLNGVERVPAYFVETRNPPRPGRRCSTTTRTAASTRSARTS